jgi:hypothetical protein
MYKISACPVCGYYKKESYPAVVSKFVKYRLQEAVVWEKPRIVKCKECGLIYFDARYTPRNVAVLYTDYRTPSYVMDRAKFEKGYTKALNASFDSWEAVLYRRALILDFLVSAEYLNSVRRVCDYGGDRGQFIPVSFEARYVDDASQKTPVKGVKHWTQHRNLVDLVMLCHVLEHLSDPLETLQKIRTDYLISNGYVYIEVPLDGVFYLKTKNRGLNFIRDILVKIPIALRVLSYVFGIFKVHEHLNYFNDRSLLYLLDVSGFDILRMKELDCKIGGYSGCMIQALARAR